MIRQKVDDPWREVSWDEAIIVCGLRVQTHPGEIRQDAVGGITSSRCTNEETFLVQKLIRAVFGNNNVDTCARVCHSPTGYGLGQTFGTSAGTQDFDSVEQTDVVIVIGANPTAAHPVFASRLQEAPAPGREADRHRSAPHRDGESPHMSRPRYHLPLLPGTNVAIVTALAHVIVTEGLYDENFVRERCDWDEFQHWAEFVAMPQTFARSGCESSQAYPPRRSAARRGSMPPAATARSITVSASPSTARARPP